MTKLTKGQMAKLPKWAQGHIDRLYMQLDELRAQKEEWFRDGRLSSSQIVLPYFHGIDTAGSGDQGLAHNQSVRFYPRPREERRWSEYIDVRLDDRGECVHVHGAVGGLIIEPCSGNTCNLKVRNPV